MDITSEELQERLSKNESMNMIDVRETYEREEFNVGGEHMPLAELMARPEEIPFGKEDEIVVYCKSGGRSGVAIQHLRGLGYQNLRNLTGGMLGYQAIRTK